MSSKDFLANDGFSCKMGPFRLQTVQLYQRHPVSPPYFQPFRPQNVCNTFVTITIFSQHFVAKYILFPGIQLSMQENCVYPFGPFAGGTPSCHFAKYRKAAKITGPSNRRPEGKKPGRLPRRPGTFCLFLPRDLHGPPPLTQIGRRRAGSRPPSSPSAPGGCPAPPRPRGPPPGSGRRSGWWTAGGR